MKSPITQKELKELLRYNVSTGKFFWKVFRPRVKPGQITAQALDRWGYHVISVNRRKYKAHRLAWLYVYGVFPAKDLDHKNRIKTDNRISNLREVTATENARNKGLNKKNKSGFVGVSWKKSHERWCAQASVDGVVRYLGLYDSPLAASQARNNFLTER
jgi:hypothetical protein